MNSTTQYNYNSNNVPTSITYPSGRTVTYTLDTVGRVSQISSTATLASSINYLPFGAITGLTYGRNLWGRS